MTIQDQYTTSVRQTQQVAADAIGSITRDVQNAFGQSAAFADPNAAIDRVFDFWAQALATQRDFAKRLANLTAVGGETVRTQIEAVGETVQKQVESTKEAAREQLAHRYDELTKPELQDELTKRDLPKSGNVDDLRARLLENDQK